MASGFPIEVLILPEIEGLWDELGLDEAERSESIEGLSKQVAQLYSHFQDCLVDRCSQVRNEIAAIKDKHQRALRAFGMTESEINQEVSPISRTNLIKQLVQAKQALANFQSFIAGRIHKLNSLVHAARELFDALGADAGERGEFNEVGHTDFTRERIERFRTKIAALQQEKEERLTRIVVLKSDISALLTDLNTVPQGDDHAVLTNESVSTGQIAKLISLKEKLERRKSERVSEISSLAVTITHLWDMLLIEGSERIEFLRSHSSLGDDVVESCQAEVARLSGLRDQKLPGLITAQRDQVAQLWETLHIAEESRPQFARQSGDDLAQANVKEFNFLRAEISRLKTLLAELQPILELVHQREEIVRDYSETLSSAADPNRLTSRGRGCAQQRMREEKARRRFQVTLPKLERKLGRLLIEYRTNKGTDFEWNGRPYLDGDDFGLKIRPTASCPTRVRSVHTETDDGEQKAVRIAMAE
jgi:SMC interacting uncharacterized protein involved in chromosome segregation